MLFTLQTWCSLIWKICDVYSTCILYIHAERCTRVQMSTAHMYLSSVSVKKHMLWMGFQTINSACGSLMLECFVRQTGCSDAGSVPAN